MMNVAVALFLVLSSLVTVEPEVCSPPQEKPPNPPPEDAIVVEHSTHRVKQVLDRARDVKEHAQEAVSEALSKAKDFVPRKTSEVSDVIRAACRISYDFGQTTANKVSSAVTEKVVPTVNQYVPGERGRAKIGRFTTSFVRNAAVYGLPEVLKYWVPGGVPVYDIASQSLRDVKTEDYEEAKTKTEHCKEELKRLLAEVDKLERKLSGGAQNIQDDVKLERESSVGKDNWADAKFESGAASFKCAPEGRRNDQNVYDEGI